MFPDARQALCAYHVRAATQQGLQQRLVGTLDEQADAYEAFEQFVKSIMYMNHCSDEAATFKEAKRRLAEFNEACNPSSFANIISE